MSSVLGLSGSPILGSSTELLVKEILRGARSRGASTEYIYLNALDLLPCQSCGRSPDEGYCFFHDGMDEIYAKFTACDALVIGSPVYFDSVSAQTKLFIDRTNCFRAFAPDTDGLFIPRMTRKRKGAIVLVGGEREEYEYARRVIGGFFVWANVEPAGLLTYAHADSERGTVIRRPEILQAAYDLGTVLAGEQIASGSSGQ